MLPRQPLSPQKKALIYPDLIHRDFDVMGLINVNMKKYNVYEDSIHHAYITCNLMLI